MPAAVPKDRQRERLGYERRRRFGHLEARRMFEPGAPTLDERISSTWSSLLGSGSAECPVCATRVRAAEPCSGCGSKLS